MRHIITLMIIVAAGLALLSFARPKRWERITGKMYRRMRTGGLCSDNLYFLNDSVYTYEGGCEASSYYSPGHWSRRGDTLLFRGDSMLQILPAFRVRSSRVTGDSIEVRIRDAKGAITRGISVGLRRRNGSRISYWYDERDSQFHGQAPVGEDTLSLFRLERSYHRSYVLPTDSGNHFELVVDVPPLMPAGGGSRRFYQYPFMLVRRGDSLVVPDLPPFEERSAYLPVKD